MPFFILLVRPFRIQIFFPLISGTALKFSAVTLFSHMNDALDLLLFVLPHLLKKPFPISSSF